MNAIAIILARAGSKGLPGKNTMPIAGRPCIAWTIDAARRSTWVSQIIVSTDCPIAAGIAREYSCTVIHRPPALASDTATVDDAARHAIATAGPDVTAASRVVILYANVPVRPRDLIDRAGAMLVESGCDSVQSYAPVGKNHPWWMSSVNSDGRVAPWEGTVLNHGVFRRQDLPPAYVPDGGVIAVTVDSLMLRVPNVTPGPHAFLGREGQRRAIITREGDVIDIDSAIDAAVADAVLRCAAA